MGLTTDTAFNNCAVAIKIKYIIFINFFVGEVLVFLFLCKMNMGGHHKFKYIFLHAVCSNISLEAHRHIYLRMVLFFHLSGFK